MARCQLSSSLEALTIKEALPTNTAIRGNFAFPKLVGACSKQIYRLTAMFYKLKKSAIFEIFECKCFYR